MSVVILDSSNNQIKKFYQWDYNLSIYIIGALSGSAFLPIDLTDITITDGGYINTYGTVRSSSGSAYTDYIAVTPGHTVRMSGVYLNGNRRICFYDSEQVKTGTPIGGTSDTTVTFEVPDGAAYIRVSTKISNTLTASDLDPNRFPDIHFASGSCNDAISITPEIIISGDTVKLKALVPNGLLMRPEAVRIFFYTNTGADEYRTTYETTIPVMPRQMPSDYAGGSGSVSSVVEVKPLVVSANGYYPTRVGTAWSPVTVNVGCDYYNKNEAMLPYYRYIVDTASDLSQISNPGLGTIAYCIEDGHRYVAKSNGSFVVMRNNYY